MDAHVPTMSIPAPYDRSGEASNLGPGGLARAFDVLFCAEYPKVVGIAARVLADRAEAEDVAQEVFMAFHRSHSPLAGYAAAWLHRAAWHTALNALRGRRRRELRERADRVRSPDDLWAGDPGHIVELAFEREQVRTAIRKLPPRAAGALVLRYSGLSYAEVAQAMGIGVGQVGTVLRRAEARLKREVES